MKKISFIKILEKKEQLQINKIVSIIKQSILNNNQNIKNLKILNNYYIEYSIKLNKEKKLGITCEIWNNYANFLNILKIGVIDKQNEVNRLKKSISNYNNKFLILQKKIDKWTLLQSKVDDRVLKRKKILNYQSYNELLQRIIFSTRYALNVK